MTARAAVLIFVLAVTVAAQTPAEGRYQSKFENDVVAVYDIDLPSRASASAFQSAHDSVWLALSDANVSFALSQEGKVDLQLQIGDARFFPSFETRQLTNTGTTEFRGVMIAIKARGLATSGCECTGNTGKALCGCKGATHLESLWAFSLGEVTLAGTSLKAGEAFRNATMRDDMLLVAVTDIDLEDESKADTDSGVARAVHLRAGDAVWIPRGLHQFKNVGESSGRFVTAEF